MLVAVITSALTIWGFQKFSTPALYIADSNPKPQVHYASHTMPVGTQPVDFSQASKEAVRAVVHIKTLRDARLVRHPSPFGDIGMRVPAQMGSGSGVLVSADGYIVTNNHVVQGADKVQVTFNNRNHQIAEVVGTDPSTDLAVLKIEGKDLPYMEFGNSDDVELGQWVLAVGYPLNLDITVTAGIVSGKSRSLDLPNKDAASAVSSFIQTDAAVNPGNSGGPLVNTAGQVIGINSAIASPTGTYAGYSYAIPSNVVRKVVNDLIKYGEAKRAYLGVAVIGLDNLSVQQAKQLGIGKEEFESAEGVYVDQIMDGSAAERAGIKQGDFITAVNGIEVNTSPQLIEQLALYHPGDKISIGFVRGAKKYNKEVVLKGSDRISGATPKAPSVLRGNTGSVSPFAGQGSISMNSLGAKLKALSPEEAETMGLEGGVKVLSLSDGLLKNETNIQPGFVISKINGKEIQSVEELEDLVKASPNSLRIGGTYPGRNGIYYFGIQHSSR